MSVGSFTPLLIRLCCSMLIYYAVRAPAMMIYFFGVRFNISRNRLYFIEIPFFDFQLHFSDQFFIHLRKVIYEVQRILNLMCNARSEFAKACHFLGLN